MRGADDIAGDRGRVARRVEGLAIAEHHYGEIAIHLSETTSMSISGSSRARDLMDLSTIGLMRYFCRDSSMVLIYQMYSIIFMYI